MKKTGVSTLFQVLLMTAIAALLLVKPCCAAQTAAGPVPPDFILEKSLPGEDPYWMYRPQFSPDAKHAACFASSSHRIVIWNLETAKIEKEIEESVHGMPGLDGYTYSNDGKMLILIYRDLPVVWLDIASEKIVKKIDAKADPKKVWDFTFSPDQKVLALATNTGIKLYDVDKGVQTKTFLAGKAVSGAEICYYRTEKGQLVRLLGYGLYLDKDSQFKDVAGIIDLDSGSVRPVLNDVPKDKVKKGDMTLIWVTFERGGGYMLVQYTILPPTVKAGVYLVNTRTGKFLVNHDLDQMTLSYNTYYLWKPYYGYLLNTKDMRQNPYKISTEFLIITKDEGLKVIDTKKEDKYPFQSITVSSDQKWALIATKKSQQDPSKVFLYRIVPKK